MKINVLRELEIKERGVELLLEVDEELLDVYRSETGDHEDPPEQEEFDEWLNSLINYALEGEEWRLEEE